MNIKLIEPYGFCNGVENSINIAKKAILENPNKKVYIIGEIIHNDETNEYFRKQNCEIIMLENEELYIFLNMINHDSIVVLRADGAEKEIYNILNSRNIKYYDATCHIVNKINNTIIENKDKNIIYIGLKKHSESHVSLKLSNNIILYEYVENKFYGEINKNDEYIVINQSTLSNEEIENAFNSIKKYTTKIIDKTFNCPFVTLRQDKIKSLINPESLFLIVGSKSSNNTKSLLKICEKYSKTHNYYLISNLSDLEKIDLNKYKDVYIASGTSAPKTSVEKVFNYLKDL